MPHTHTHTSALTSKVVGVGVEVFGRNISQFSRVNNGHDNTIDGYHFTENDGNQISRLNTRCLDGTTQQCRTCNKDTPYFASVKQCAHKVARFEVSWAYQAAPVTERPIQRPMPVKAQAKGEVSWSTLPTLNCSPEPVKSIYNPTIVKRERVRPLQ